MKFEIANLDSILFWHKIVERKGFRINGFINHYPDFLILTQNKKTIIVEKKGDDKRLKETSAWQKLLTHYK